MLPLLLSPSAMFNALLAGLFLRAQLVDFAQISGTLFDFGIDFNNFVVLLCQVLLKVSLFCSAFLACQLGLLTSGDLLVARRLNGGLHGGLSGRLIDSWLTLEGELLRHDAGENRGFILRVKCESLVDIELSVVDVFLSQADRKLIVAFQLEVAVFRV